jgi:hypothetical protein
MYILSIVTRLTIPMNQEAPRKTVIIYLKKVYHLSSVVITVTRRPDEQRSERAEACGVAVPLYHHAS